MRALYGVGKPRALQGLRAALRAVLVAMLTLLWRLCGARVRGPRENLEESRASASQSRVPARSCWNVASATGSEPTSLLRDPTDPHILVSRRSHPLLVPGDALLRTTRARVGLIDVAEGGAAMAPYAVGVTTVI